MPPGRLTIDLVALAHNYQLLKDKVEASCAVAGVVKADAYGLGARQIVPILEKLGCPYYFVATAQEAIDLRRMTAKPIAVLNGLMGPAEEYLKHDISPVLNSLREIEIWHNAATKLGRRLEAIIHFDTGMNRLGLDQFEVRQLMKEPYRLNNLDVALIMTHMACADDRLSPMTTRQYEEFRLIAAEFPNAKKSVGNSSALFRSSNYHQDYARPGMALYGLNPTPERPNPMKPVISLDARVLQVRRVKNGDTIGYGAATIMTYDATLATVAIGYADGILRSGTNNLNLYWQDKECPVRGRISMDTIVVDITGHKPVPMPGDFLEVIGPNQSVDDLAAACGTIGYEILTNIGMRYQRIYKGA
ncbi:MAG: alanine racemase [Alphaproteobacteria bacterium]|nr:alanine racemase [Alphaproteobacteria bacterium]